MPKKPIMIGAHTPRKARRRMRRCALCETASLINHHYNEVFLRSEQRTHLVYQPTLCSPVSGRLQQFVAP